MSWIVPNKYHMLKFFFFFRLFYFSTFKLIKLVSVVKTSWKSGGGTKNKRCQTELPETFITYMIFFLQVMQMISFHNATRDIKVFIFTSGWHIDGPWIDKLGRKHLDLLE